jgi:hypothetical protein
MKIALQDARIELGDSPTRASAGRVTVRKLYRTVTIEGARKTYQVDPSGDRSAGPAQASLLRHADAV